MTSDHAPVVDGYDNHDDGVVVVVAIHSCELFDVFAPSMTRNRRLMMKSFSTSVSTVVARPTKRDSAI